MPQKLVNYWVYKVDGESDPDLSKLLLDSEKRSKLFLFQKTM